MSSSDRPEFTALADLEAVIHHLTEELAGWRRRALKAEADRAELGGPSDTLAVRERRIELEAENVELKLRVDAARDRVRDLLMRLRFLEEQGSLEGQRQ